MSTASDILVAKLNGSFAICSYGFGWSQLSRFPFAMCSRISALNSFLAGSKVEHRLITLTRFRW
ncbi:hypothetical protein DAI22_11g203070 [Oryza sativa Japonica Group]|nr:hypothetical protein DAI22_11g203070 [Oryza sativa Japonica Group]